MFGSGIGISGLASGLDTNSIIQQLVALEKIPINILESSKKGEQDKLSAINKLKGLVKDLQTKSKELGKKSDFLEFAVTASAEGVATFSATGLASPGNHTLTVKQLAAIDRWAFDGVASAEADLATGAGQQLSFDVGDTNYSITVQEGESSLYDIASEINGLANADVTASVVNSGTTTSPSYKLVLTSKTSGEEGRISGISSTIGGLTIDGASPDGQGVAQSTNNITVGLNAIAVIDGLEVQRTTNEFNDVLAGISLTAAAADPTKTITFAVEANDEAITKKVDDLVKSYNAVMSFINEQSKYDEDAGTGGPLFGDSMLAQVRMQIRGALFNVPLSSVQNDTEGYSTLSLLGIKTENDGTLTIDKTKMEEKLQGNLDAFADLFVDADGFDNDGALENTPEYYIDTSLDSGLAATLDRVIQRMFSTTSVAGGLVLKGIFDSKTQTLNDKIKRINDDIDDKTTYLEKYQENLVAKFAKLEEIMGGLNAQGASLQAALAGL